MATVQPATVRIAKDFHWEMGHRLPFHAGACRNLHGHSYRMQVVVEGTLDANGMVLDYFDLKEIVQPLVDRLDHAFLCDANDSEMLGFFERNPLKYVVVPFTTTAENLAGWFAVQIAELLASYPNVLSIDVRIHETERSYAERSLDVNASSA